MSAPADTPPPREGHDPAPSPDHVGLEVRNPVLSLEDRKAERRRLRESEDIDPDRRQAKLLRMEGRKAGKNGNGRARAPDPLAQTGEVPPVPQIVTPAAGAAGAVGPARRRDLDLDDDDGFGYRPLPGSRATPSPVPRTAGPARARVRHWGILVSFLLLVVAPVAVAGWYLWERASPRFGSSVGFSVRTEEGSSALDALGGMIALGAGGSSSSDTDILYRYIQSQEIVRAIDAKLDLRTLWAKGDPERDPVFAYHAPGTIEDLVDYWARMVSVYNDTGTGLLDIEVQAFAPEDAQAIAQAIYEESQRLINELSDIALADKTELARQELDEAIDRLKEARAGLTQFRNVNQIVDPSASIQSQMGLQARLEEQLAQTLIELDLLRQSASDDDPRVEQALDRVDVIQARIADERAKLGIGRGSPVVSGGDEEGEPAPANPDSEAFADLLGDYERLQVDQEFAQQSYIAAMATYNSALTEGRQQSRYLAAHVEPTLAERADYPQRWMLTLLTGLFALLAWMMLTLGAYAVRDRR